MNELTNFDGNKFDNMKSRRGYGDVILWLNASLKRTLVFFFSLSFVLKSRFGQTTWESSKRFRFMREFYEI